MTKICILTSQDKIVAIEKNFRSIMEILGLNLKDASLKDTPRRVAKMYVEEICSALHTEPPKFTVFPNKNKLNQIVLVKKITLNSMCEHHFVPFVGTAYVAYLPKNKYAGLSKFNRVVQYFGKKPQVQEKLGDEILKHLQDKLGTEDVAVILNCQHFCVCMRGVKDPSSTTITSHLGGIFFDAAARQELFNMINLE